MKELLYLLALLIAFPTGLLLSRLCREELDSWKKRTIIISFIGIILSLIISINKVTLKTPIITSLIFISLTNFVIFKQASKSKHIVKKKITKSIFKITF